MLMWALLGLLALVNGVGAFASLPLQPGRLDAMARWSLQEPAAPAKPEESILYAQDLVEAKEPEIRNSAEAEPERFLEGRALMDDVLDTVVRIYATHSVPSFSMPWQRQRQEQSTSSGFLIEGRRIITNAHSVEYSSMIQVRLRASDHKYVARVLAVGEECDLAVLTVDEDDFWEQTHPPAFGALPELQDDVVVLGYPVGGETLSITRGVVSRVEMTVYTQAGMELLSMQIDAAINPGNSGGPVLNAAGEISGVAFQSLDGEGIENIGYVVPVTVVKHFLEDVHRNGHFSGFPRLGTHLQGLESPALRNSLGMQDGDTGMLVTEVEPISPAAGVLKAGDVLLDVDGLKVACDGTVPFREGERIALRYYFTNRFPGDVINLKCLRNGQVTQCSVELGPVRSLCPAHFDGKVVNTSRTTHAVHAPARVSHGDVYCRWSWTTASALWRGAEGSLYGFCPCPLRRHGNTTYLPERPRPLLLPYRHPPTQ
ncbi:unnamed protein product [Chrysoparadoxa australica]